MTPRIFLAVAGATSLLNTSVILELQKAENRPSGTLLLVTLLFATLSFINGLLMIFAAWQLPRLLGNARGFVKFTLLMRYALILIQYGPPAINYGMPEGSPFPFLPISLIILWSGVTFYLLNMIDALAADAKPANR